MKQETEQKINQMIDSFRGRLEKLDDVVNGAQEDSDPEVNRLDHEVNEEIKNLNIFSSSDFQNNFLNWSIF